MANKEIEELKAEMLRIERERKERSDSIIAWAIGIVIVIALVFAYHRGSTGVNAPSPNDPPCEVTNDSGGQCQ